MSFRRVRETYWEPNPEPPSTGNNLHPEDELQAMDVEVLARRLFKALEVHKHCPVCAGEAKWARDELQRLGIHV